MLFIPVPNNAKFELIYLQSGVRTENVFHVQSTVSSWTLSELRDMAGIFAAWWIGQMRPLVGDHVSLEAIDATSLHTETSPKTTYTTGLPLPGTGTGTPLPNNVTLVVKWTTDLRGRSYRGRTYHVGLFQEQIDENTVLNAPLAGLVSAYAALKTAINVNPYTMRIVSYRHNKAWLTEGVATAVTGMSIDATLDSQRRRMPH